jgi:hypothetical protein
MFNADGVATNFVNEVAASARHFCTLSIDITAGIEGWSVFARSAGSTDRTALCGLCHQLAKRSKRAHVT